MADLASLSAQLPDNLAQLVQLDELLQADPTNEELISLRDDLRAVIQMTIDLQKAAGQSADAAATAAVVPSAPAAAAEPAAAAAAMPHSAVSTDAGLSSAAAASSYVSPSVAAAVSALPINGVYPAGARVMAEYEQDHKFYVARIDRVDHDLEQYQVTFLEYGQTANIGFSSVRPWVCATPEQLRAVNTPVKAMFPEDGIFYNASIDGPSPNGPIGHAYIVKFGHLGGKKKKKVEVPINDIILNERFINPLSLQLTSAASAGSKAAAAGQLPEEMPVPEYLVIHDGDSDAVKQSKMRKLKKLRYEHRRAYEEQESKKRASSWQDFKAGKLQPAAKKAKLTHGLQALQKKSMFATPETIDGVVGVVGSGRGVTELAPTKKYALAPAPPTQP